MEFRTITAPFTEEVLKSLKVGEIVNVSGKIYAARDAVLPKIGKMIDSGVRITAGNSAAIKKNAGLYDLVIEDLTK